MKFELEMLTGDDGFGNERCDWCHLVNEYVSLKVERAIEAAHAMAQEGRVIYKALVRSNSKTRQIDTRTRAIMVHTGDEYNVRAVYPLDKLSGHIELILERGASS